MDRGKRIKINPIDDKMKEVYQKFLIETMQGLLETGEKRGINKISLSLKKENGE